MDPFTIILSAVAVYIIYNTFFNSTKKSNPLAANGSSSSSSSSAGQQKPVLEGKFTPQTLYKYNGFDEPNIYIAVSGKVYDVSRARQFYGPSGPYSNFAGHDASRGLALNSFEMEMITPFEKPIDKLEDLSPQDRASLTGWEEHFANKYPCIGVLVNPDEL